ncbi:MAG TPA: metallophosphoesterase [Thermoleophilaceae bacterium]|nr:metallophosphoesterase [Thermoleophilaceae bacterium]
MESLVEEAESLAEGAGSRSLVAMSDLHLEVPENRAFFDDLRPESDGDWLIVCGDVAAEMASIEWGLRTLAERYAKVVWVPGNHELWTLPNDPTQLRGEERYRHIVEYCRGLGIVTPEDPYPVWDGPGGPALVAPLFTLYDYSFTRVPGASKEESLAQARAAGIVCRDEMLLHPQPHESIDAWCRERVRLTAERLAEAENGIPSVLVNHWPLVRRLTAPLRYPDFAQWCGTELTADWHRRYGATVVVCGHLHIPRTTMHEDVRFEEVSLGYPREWGPRRRQPSVRRILPVADGGR